MPLGRCPWPVLPSSHGSKVSCAETVLSTSRDTGTLSISPSKFHPLLFAWASHHSLCHPWLWGVGGDGNQSGGRRRLCSLANPFCSLAGLNPAGRGEQSCGVQRSWAHQGRCQGGFPKFPGQWPVRPQLAQNRPQHPGQGCLTLHRLQAGAGAAYWRQGKHWHPRKDCHWQTLIWQCPHWCKYCTCWFELGWRSALCLQPVNESGLGVML